MTEKTATATVRRTKTELAAQINDMRRQMAASKAELTQELEWIRHELEIAYALELYHARHEIHAASKYPPLAAGQVDMGRLLFELTAHAHRNAAAAVYAILQGPLQGHPSRNALSAAIRDRTHLYPHDHVDAQLAPCRNGVCGASRDTVYQVHYQEVTRAYEHQYHAAAA
jgi:hypothetical protein